MTPKQTREILAKRTSEAPVASLTLVDRSERIRRAERIAVILGELFPDPAVPLNHTDSFTLLVAVILSAQSTDKTVNKVIPHLFALASTPGAMAEMTVTAIRDIIKPCGLSERKAKALHVMSRLLIDRHGGLVPDKLADLEALPGVGHKTASVVISQAFGQAAFPVDTHIHRLAARWGLSSGRNVRQTERDLKEVFPPADWNRLHIQMILFGRRYCPAKGHDQVRCPICRLFRSNEPDQ